MKVHESRMLEGVDVTRVDGIPVTTPARTIIDLAGDVDEETLEIIIDDAIRRGLVSVEYLQKRLNALSANGRHGVVMLRRLLNDRDPAQATPESDLETLFKRGIRRKLAKPEAQYEIFDGAGLIGRADFAYPEQKLAIELDGGQHATKRQWQKDLRRRNRLTAIGWRMINLTRQDLESGEFVDQIRDALGSTP